MARKKPSGLQIGRMLLRPSPEDASWRLVPLPFRIMSAVIAVPTIWWLNNTGTLRRWVARWPNWLRWAAVILVAAIGIVGYLAGALPWLVALIALYPLVLKLAPWPARGGGHRGGAGGTPAA